MNRLGQLKARLADVHNLSRAASVLGWDQQVYMPPGGAQARGEQIATLARLSHNIFIADETGALLQAAAGEVKDLLEGRITVDEAPEVWNRKMQGYLGITPPTDTLGILQDVHWSGGMMGYFSTYSLGNILSVQLWDKAIEERPEIPEEISRGEFGALRGWLTEKVYRYGRKFEPSQLIEMATGEPLQSRSYLRYLKTKYRAIYGLSGEPVAAR